MLAVIIIAGATAAVTTWFVNKHKVVITERLQKLIKR